MKNLSPAKKSLKLNKETISKFSVNSSKIDSPSTVLPTTSQLCFDLAVLAERV
jgi:hypothetical protein